jgi:hypothetical protein
LSITIRCNCGKTFVVADEYAGKRVRCSACKAVLEVRGPGERQTRRRDEAVAPERPSRRPRTYEEDDEPRERRPRTYEEDDELRERSPRRRPRKNESGMMWLIIGGVCLLVLLVGGGVTAIILALGGPSGSSGNGDGTSGGGRGWVDRRAGMNNLKQLGLAMHNYHDVNRQFPSAVSTNPQVRHPNLSWRVDLLPYIEYDNLYKQIRRDEPYDSPHNRQFWSQMPKVYAAPGADPSQGKTRYQIFAGPNTPLHGSKPTIFAITDGTSNTILIAEAGREVNWMAPEDIPFQQSPGGFPGSNLGDPGNSSFQAVLCDGSTREFPKTINPITLQNLIMSNDGNLINFP